MGCLIVWHTIPPIIKSTETLAAVSKPAGGAEFWVKPVRIISGRLALLVSLVALSVLVIGVLLVLYHTGLLDKQRDVILGDSMVSSQLELSWKNSDIIHDTASEDYARLRDKRRLLVLITLFVAVLAFVGTAGVVASRRSRPVETRDNLDSDLEDTAILVEPLPKELADEWDNERNERLLENVTLFTMAITFVAEPKDTGNPYNLQYRYNGKQKEIKVYLDDKHEISILSASDQIATHFANSGTGYILSVLVPVTYSGGDNVAVCRDSAEFELTPLADLQARYGEDGLVYLADVMDGFRISILP